MALSYINNKEIKFGSSKPLNGVYTPSSPTREYEPLDSLGIYLNSGIPLSYGVENGRYMSMSDEFAATSQGNSYSFNQLFAAQMMLGFRLHDRFIACDTEHKIIGTEPLLQKAYLAEITEKTLDYFKIKIYGDKTRTFCIRMSSSEVPTSYVDLTNSFDENGLNLTQTDRQSFLSYYRFYPLTARDPSSRAEETLGVDYYLLPSAEGLKELSGDILSKFNAFISSDGTLTSLGNTAFAYAGDIDYVPNYRGETSEAAVSAAESARVILGQVEEMHADINQILPEMEENLELTKQYRDEAMSTEIGTVREDLNRLEGDLANSKKAIVELEDKKITKFYASNNGNTYLPDSDNGKPSDMKIFGKSVQDGTPTPDAPVEIQSVVNPSVLLYTNLYGGEINTLYPFAKKLNNGDKFFIGNYDGEASKINLYDENKVYKDYFTADKGTRIITNIVDNIVYFSIPKGTKIMVTNTDYEVPYTEYKPIQSATLPYTLNAIPVTSGGNVTIDGQQYIADYVDVDRRKLVKMVNRVTETKTCGGPLTSGGLGWANLSSDGLDINMPVAICNKYPFVTGTGWSETSPCIAFNNSDQLRVYDTKGTIFTVEYIYPLTTPTETDLTESDITALSSLATYYPITNASVASDQLDGHAIFNYPLNMANGWNYVMQQIGETRPIIYDTQVKTIENLIDTAILTAMMEA